MSTAPASSPNPAVADRLKPLTELLSRSHGPRLRTVTGYGEWLHSPADRRLPAHVLVVIDGLDPARLRADAAEVSMFGRLGLDPLFLELRAFGNSLDVFPLEFLEMQALYEVVNGDDLLAGLEFPPASLRLQVEEELRSLRCGLHQELAREGHRPRALRRMIAQRFGELSRVWRGMLSLAGQPVPAESLPLQNAVADQYGLDRLVLDQLRAVHEDVQRPDFEELGRIADTLDRLLATVTAQIDALDGAAG